MPRVLIGPIQTSSIPLAVNVLGRRIFMALNWEFDLIFQGLISARLIKIMQASQNVGPSHQDDQG